MCFVNLLRQCFERIIPQQFKVLCCTILLPIPEYTAYYIDKCAVLISKAVPLQARRGPEVSRKLSFPDFVTMAQDGGRLTALRTSRLYPRKYSWYSFLLEASRPQDQSAIGRIMSMRNSNVTIWNRTSDLPTCSTVLPRSLPS